MKVTVIGTGYVGLVTGACLAQVGNNVVCVDIDEKKIQSLREGKIPIHEPGLEQLVQQNTAEGRLHFTTDLAEGVAHGLFLFIAVGTPPDEDGSADLRHVLAVAEGIGTHMDEYRIIVDKSTVPVGTADKVEGVVRQALAKRAANLEFDVVSNPEFLKEGAAVNDFMKPDRIIVGTKNPRTAELMRVLYGPFKRNHEKIMIMDPRSAELTKYAANAMLATKISFMNELSRLAEKVGADIEMVREGIGSDPRIGYHFIYPGCGYGGSCFPKDVKALAKTAKLEAVATPLLDAVELVNETQKQVLEKKIVQRFGEDLSGKTFAVWGLSFKPNTDDMREAPSRTLMEGLWHRGARVSAFDPVAREEAQRIYGERADLNIVDEPYAALVGADALVVVTEWSVFRSPDFERIKDSLHTPVVFDGRNIYDPAHLHGLEIEHYAIGRQQ